MTNTDPGVPTNFEDPWVLVGKEIRARTQEPSSWEKLASEIEQLGTPTASYFAKTLRGSITTRGKRKGKLRASVSLRQHGPAVYFFVRAMHWHGGSTGGSLWGPMIDQFGGEDYHRADTMAQVLRVALDLPMTAVCRWKEALGA